MRISAKDFSVFSVEMKLETEARELTEKVLYNTKTGKTHQELADLSASSMWGINRQPRS